MPTTEQKTHAYKIFHLLKDHYPSAKMILAYGNEWELLVSVILSAQCTDVMVNKVTSRVFPKYRSLAIDPSPYKEYLSMFSPEITEMINFALVPKEELEQDIKPTGFYKNKAKSVKAAADYLLTHHEGRLPRTMKEMVNVPGAGRKTANIVLGNAFGIYEGLAVDTHVKKQAQLLGLTKQTTPEKIEQDLMALFDQKDWFLLTYLLIDHGRATARGKHPTCSMHPHCPLFLHVA